MVIGATGVVIGNTRRARWAEDCPSSEALLDKPAVAHGRWHTGLRPRANSARVPVPSR